MKQVKNPEMISFKAIELCIEEHIIPCFDELFYPFHFT